MNMCIMYIWIFVHLFQSFNQVLVFDHLDQFELYFNFLLSVFFFFIVSRNSLSTSELT